MSLAYQPRAIAAMATEAHAAMTAASPQSALRLLDTSAAASPQGSRSWARAAAEGVRSEAASAGSAAAGRPDPTIAEGRMDLILQKQRAAAEMHHSRVVGSQEEIAALKAQQREQKQCCQQDARSS